MENPLVKLGEDKDAFYALGSARVAARKSNQMVLMYAPPLEGGVPKECVRRFFINEQKNPPELYLKWEKNGGVQQETVVGRVLDLEEAHAWIAKVNRMYEL